MSRFGDSDHFHLNPDSGVIGVSSLNGSCGVLVLRSK